MDCSRFDRMGKVGSTVNVPVCDDLGEMIKSANEILGNDGICTMCTTKTSGIDIVCPDDEKTCMVTLTKFIPNPKNQ